MEIYSVGQFPEGYTPKDFIKGTERSILRNPLIAHTLYLSKDVERWGSGLKNDTRAEENVKVQFQELKSGFLVVFGRKFDVKSRESSEKILALMRKTKSISAREMAQRIGISQRSVEKQISVLKKNSALKRIGGAKGGYWEVIKTTK